MVFVKFINILKRYINPFILANAIFFNLAHLFFNIWGQPARIIILAYLICVPLLVYLLSYILKKVISHVRNITKKRLYILIVATLVLGTTLAFGNTHRFKTAVLITPELSGSQNIELLEIKVNGNILPISEYAEGYGWESDNGAVIASENSRPMLIKLSTPVNVPVTLLFGTSPKGGNLLITYGKNEEKLSLNAASPGETLKSFSTQYRNFPGWLFIPFLFGVDVIAFGLYAFSLLVIQEDGQKALSEENKKEVFLNHRTGLSTLLSLSIVLHLISILSVPIILNADSPSFLAGAIHLVDHGNFEGVSMIRGPGSTLLFAPVQALFGRNPWGMKILLHLLAIACVGLNYRLAWQLSGRRRIAFLTGLITALLPDLLFFSNYVMSDLPNIFLISLFSTLLVSALQTNRGKWIISSCLTASFAILLRSENMVLLGIGILALVFSLIGKMAMARKNKKTDHIFNIADRRNLILIILAALIALAPVIWWSAHNYRKYGFFGMSNYAGEVFYTGWIYYAEASGYPFTEQNSQAVKQIKTAVDQFPVERLNESGVATGWNLYPSLVKAGYTSSQAFEVMAAAASDSIRSNWQMAWEVLWVKLKDGLTPRTTQMFTYPLPGETIIQREIEPKFYDPETLRIIPLIKLQRLIYDVFQYFYDTFYQIFIWAGLLAAYYCLLRKPTLIWGSLVLIMLTRIFIPDIMGKSDWRYTISGLVLMQALTIAWISAMTNGLRSLIKEWRKA